MTVKQEGRRFYLENASYDHREWIKANGCHWDAATKRWWTGRAAVAEELVAGQQIATKVPRDDRDDKLQENSKLLGRAMYRGREYFLLWHGTTKAGTGAKLAYMDGSKIFWARLDDVVIINRFRNGQGITTTEDDPMTFGLYKEIVAQYRKRREENKKMVEQWRAGGSRMPALTARFPGTPIQPPSEDDTRGWYVCASCQQVVYRLSDDRCGASGLLH